MSAEMIVHPLHSGDVEENGAIVLANKKELDVNQEQMLATLRNDREAHRHKTIWTKDAHGGPYRKANPNSGYDPLKQNPDGTLIEADLGYQQVETGPTSNFVGNHMTQGAIDLVQAELGHKPLGNLKLDAAPRATAPAICLPSHQPPLTAIPRRQLRLQEWKDHGNAIRVVFSLLLERPEEENGAETKVECMFTSTSFDISVHQPGPGILYGFNAPALWAEILPLESSCIVEGTSGVEGDERRLDTSCTDEKDRRCTIVTKPGLPSAVVLWLAKADPSTPWDDIASKTPLVPVALPMIGKQPDLTALRQAVRRQRLG